MYDFGFIVGVFWVVVFECGVFGVKFGKLVIVVNEVMNKIVDGELKRVFFFVKFDMCQVNIGQVVSIVEKWF